MSYNAQELNTKVELQRRTITEDAYGQQIETWTKLADMFAKVEPLVGREYIAGGAEASEVKLKVTIRFYAGLTATDRVVIGGDAFEIVDAQNIRFRNREHLLYCKRVA